MVSCSIKNSSFLPLIVELRHSHEIIHFMATYKAFKRRYEKFFILQGSVSLYKKEQFLSIFQATKVSCIEEKSFSKYSFNSSSNLRFYMTAMTFVTVATKFISKTLPRKMQQSVTTIAGFHLNECVRLERLFS